MRLRRWLIGKEPIRNAGDMCWKDHLKKTLATHSGFLPRKFYRQRSSVGYSPWGYKRALDTYQLNNNNNVLSTHQILQSHSKEWMKNNHHYSLFWNSVSFLSPSSTEFLSSFLLLVYLLVLAFFPSLTHIFMENLWHILPSNLLPVIIEIYSHIWE